MSTATLEREAKAERIDNDLADIARVAKAKFVTAAVRSAKGESLTADEIQAACTAAGRSIDQFQRVVKVVRQRLDALAQLDGMKEKHTEAERLDAEQRGLAEQIKTLDNDYHAKRKALAESYVRKCGELQAASTAANWQQSSALGVLRNTAANPDGDIRDPGNVKID